MRHNELRSVFGKDIVSKQRRRCWGAYGSEEHASLFLVLGPHWCMEIKVMWGRDLLITDITKRFKYLILKTKSLQHAKN